MACQSDVKIDNFQNVVVKFEYDTEHLLMHADKKDEMILYKLLEKLKRKSADIEKALSEHNIDIEKSQLTITNLNNEHDCIQKKYMAIRTKNTAMYDSVNSHIEYISNYYTFLENLIKINPLRTSMWFINKEICSICLAINVKAVVKINHCQHKLCQACIINLLEKDPQAKCPTCRGEIVSYDLFNVETMTTQYILNTPKTIPLVASNTFQHGVSNLNPESFYNNEHLEYNITRYGQPTSPVIYNILSNSTPPYDIDERDEQQQRQVQPLQERRQEPPTDIVVEAFHKFYTAVHKM
jgi:hypothetical protein